MRYFSIVTLLMKRIYKQHNRIRISFHDNVAMEDILGRGRYGVVRLGRMLVGCYAVLFK